MSRTRNIERRVGADILVLLIIRIRLSCASAYRDWMNSPTTGSEHGGGKRSTEEGRIEAGVRSGQPGEGDIGISLVVPVYNSAATLRELHRRLAAVARGLGSCEMIFVDDGSRDDSWQVICELARSDGSVLGMRMGRNFGQHPALLAGVRVARGWVTVTLDDDLQNPPEEIPKLVSALRAGWDVVYGTPERMGHEPARNGASWLTKRILHAVLGAETAREVSAFRAFRTSLRECFAQYRSPFVNLDVLLSWGTRRFGSVVVHHLPRGQGRSGYDLRRLMLHAANMITGFSALPLHAVTVVGLTFTLFGLGTLGYVMIRALVAGSVVSGFPLLASLILVLGGVQLFGMGIIGEYLARIHFRTMDRPQYFVGATTREGDLRHD